MSRTRSLTTQLCVCMLVLAGTGAALADFKSLYTRVPDDANTLVIVDIAKLLKSNMALKASWNDRSANDAPMLVPPGTARVVMAGKLDVGRLSSVWEISVIETDRPIPVDVIASAQNGFTDTIATRPAAWTPANAYFIDLAANTLGVVAPADRQFAARWLKQKPTAAMPFSAYLQGAAGLVDSGASVIMAIDLQDAASGPGFERRLQAGEFDALNGQTIDSKAVSAVVASLRGLVMRVDVADDATGQLQVDFGTDASALAAIGKPVALELLSRGGMDIPDFAAWDVKVQGTQLTARGKLTADGIRKLLSVLAPPSPNVAEGSASPGGSQPPVNEAVTAATASQSYFRAVSKILDNIPAQTALSKNAGWLARDAKRIDQMPSLNVDPELLVWGGGVSAGFNDAAQALANGQLRANSRVAGVSLPPGYNGNDPDARAAARAEMQNANNQRRQVAQEERAKASEEAFKILAAVKSTRNKIRADMVAKYKVEF